MTLSIKRINEGYEWIRGAQSFFLSSLICCDSLILELKRRKTNKHLYREKYDFGFCSGVRVSPSTDVNLSSIIALDNEVGFHFNTMVNSTVQDVTAAGGGSPVMGDAFVLITSHGNTFLSNGAFQINGTYLSIYDSRDNVFRGGSSSFSRAGNKKAKANKSVQTIPLAILID
jgi:hypothetical protein